MKLALVLPVLLALALPAQALNLTYELPSTNVEVAAPSKCRTKEGFMTFVKQSGLQLWTLTPSGLKKLRDRVNMNRSRVGKTLMSDKAVFYFVSIAPNTTGIIFIDGDCIVEDTDVAVDSAMFAKILFQAGVKDDEFSKVQDI